ncbi:VanZ family protein [Streptomyces sp. NPDC026665]|uniref:VanZ family protein n=1 Tax=Streptomyces sp. NPDC026665 TaxID=3154798 RepID=UPI0033D7D8A9
MIEASISAVPGLATAFLIFSALFALPTAFLLRARGKPWRLPTALAVYMAGILSVTTLPGSAGLEAAQCDIGAPIHLLSDESALLNVALFAPGALLAVLALRRPVTVAAAFGCLSGALELVQSLGHLGRSCTLTDLTANATGSILGAGAGAIWCLIYRTRTYRPKGDVAWGISILVLGGGLCATLFLTRIESVDVVAKDDAQKQQVDAAVDANAWLSTAAKATFGTDTEIVSSSVKFVGDKQKVTAETNRGNIAGWWPEKHLETAWAKDNRGDKGTASQRDAVATADRFARKWFPDSVDGSTQKVRVLGEGPTRAYMVTYRRYKDGVLMPMRLDITITTAKRILGFNARTMADPKLPSVIVDEKKARALAHHATGRATESTLLLAQEISGVWRPVWLVGSGNQDIAIDASTGQQVVAASPSGSSS